MLVYAGGDEEVKGIRTQWSVHARQALCQVSYTHCHFSGQTPIWFVLRFQMPGGLGSRSLHLVLWHSARGTGPVTLSRDPPPCLMDLRLEELHFDRKRVLGDADSRTLKSRNCSCCSGFSVPGSGPTIPWPLVSIKRTRLSRRQAAQ